MKINRQTLHPATLFFLLTAAIIFLSWIFDIYQASVIHPQTGERIYVQSLIGSEGIRWLLYNVTTNFTGFAPLGMTLVAMLGIGAAQHSGFMDACIRRIRGAKTGQGAGRIICGVICLGILSNVVGDAGYIVLLPIAATLFQSAGLHPVGGIITAFVSVACGYSANIVISTLDPLMARITQEAATEAGLPQGVIGSLSNCYFMFVSTFLIVGIVYYLTVKKLLPTLGAYKNEKPTTDNKPLSQKERRSLSLALTVGAIYVVIILLATFSPQGVLRGVTDGLMHSPFIKGFLFILSFGMGLVGTVYGFSSGRYKTDKDIIEGLTQPVYLLAIYVVITFFAAQMFACLEYSCLDKYVILTAARLFSSVQLAGPAMILLFIVFIACINLCMVSATGKWTLVAFIFVPVFANMGVTPSITQCAFRIGDSATNALTPFLFYMPLVFACVRQYDKGFTYVSLLKCTWRYSVYILIGWTILFAVWYWSGVAMGM
ncbi:p-aminobenzoyl-glutamate transport protein [termite gut metagenome]|uniref:p-aminobenzoyl-glutamate transport protein n=1 Tax=termite gut metagenome TaxID=433724 RepID=A0A5J4RP66_9ZZZZ